MDSYTPKRYVSKIQYYSWFPLPKEIKCSQMKTISDDCSTVHLLTHKWTFSHRTHFETHSHFFCGCASSLTAGNISISCMIRLAITSLFAESILRDIKSNGPPKLPNKTIIKGHFTKPQIPLLASVFPNNIPFVNFYLVRRCIQFRAALIT